MSTPTFVDGIVLGIVLVNIYIDFKHLWLAKATPTGTSKEGGEK